MAGSLGTTGVVGMFLGSAAVVAAYRGSTLVWSRTNLMRDDFNDANQTLQATGRWVSLGSATYRASIVDGAMRLGLADGQLGELYSTDRARFEASTARGDDGYIEVRAASRGDGSSLFSLGNPHRTQAFRRVNNTGASLANGVGIELAASQVSIARQASNGDSVAVQACGAFDAGDRIRLTSAGNVHSLYVNGALRKAWTDTATAVAGGATNRKMAVRVDASKDPLGPRRFSPALDYVECS